MSEFDNPQITVYIQKRICFLQNLINDLQKELESLPEGKIVYSKSRKYQNYYVDDVAITGTGLLIPNYDKEKKLHMLPRSQQKIVPLLTQRDYDEKLLAKAKLELKQLSGCDKHYAINKLESVYADLPAGRKMNVNKHYRTDEEFINFWYSRTYEPGEFAPDAPEYYTDREERVRSKSEILIANELNKRAIPYKYECPLNLNGVIIRPDFTILRMRDRKELYFEHLGKMDNFLYARDQMDRLDLYEQSGYFLGQRLFITHERNNNPFNIRLFRQFLDEMFGE